VEALGEALSFQLLMQRCQHAFELGGGLGQIVTITEGKVL
jgi:hypothetical protein